MIGGVTNGTLALYKATSLTLIETFSTVRGIASDGRTFNVGDANRMVFYQY